MFRQTLGGAARNWFNDLDPKSVDSFEELSQKFLEEFSQQKRIAVIMEYLVKDSKRRAFWSLNEDILKITILKTNTPYPSRKIRSIRACTHQRPQRNKAQYAISIET
ncbi:zinc finger, CCHC-type containing protein [Tanacetum coccineum]